MMNINRMICDPQRIELFLQQQLSDEEQTAFELHLDECNNCRRRLEATAASDEVWSGVRDCLQDEPLPPDDSPSSDATLDAAGGDPALGHSTVLKLLAPTDDERMLGRLGTYEVQGVIGSGGMGVVLKAFDAALNRYVAIKVLSPHLGSSGAARKRFSREAQAAAAVVHDNVMEIHGVAETNGIPYLVMPYVRGPSLQRRLNEAGPLALVEILRIAKQAAAGLAAAHAQGLVHRDVKPANILLADGVERVKLTDFGLARAADDASLTKSGIIAGTPQYMSPEQARGEVVEQRSDLFSLGSVLYAMCTGRAPFRAETSYGVLRRITDDEPTPIRQLNPEIPEWLCQIISRLMRKQPEDRFASASEVAELLEQCLAHVQQPMAVPLPAALVPPKQRSRFFSGSRRRSGVLAMSTALVIGLFAIFPWHSAGPPDIAGRWTGDGWGTVVLEGKDGTYDGTYTDTFGQQAGTLRLQWSADERRFNGAWREGKDRFGKISLRLVDGEIRGAWTTDKAAQVKPGTPELADLWWKRQAPQAAAAEPAAWSTLVANLQGGWIVETMTNGFEDELSEVADRQCTLTVEGTMLTFRFRGPNTRHIVRSLSMSLDWKDKTQPEAVEVTMDPNGDADQMPGLIRCDGRVLRLCMSNQIGSTDRPRFFATGDKVFYYQCRRRNGDDLELRPTQAAPEPTVDQQKDDRDHPAGPPTIGSLRELPAAVAKKMLAEGRHAFAKPERGLEMGLAIRSVEPVFAIGDSVPVELLIRNVSDQKIEFVHSPRFAAHIRRANAEAAAASGYYHDPTAVPPKHVAIEPGQAYHAALWFPVGLRKDRPDALPVWNSPLVGEYSVHYSLQLVIDKTPVSLKSGAVEFQVVAGQDGDDPFPAQPPMGDDSPRRGPVASDPFAQNAELPVPHFVCRWTVDMTVNLVAYSAKTKRIAIANSNPTFILQADGNSRVKDDWQPRAEILSAQTGKRIAMLDLTDHEEDALLATAGRSPHFQVTALAFSPDGEVVAVGTSIGQIKLFDVETGKLTRSFDDRLARLEDETTPDKLQGLVRGMGSVAALAFSPDGRLLATSGESMKEVPLVNANIERLGRRVTGPGRLKVWNIETGEIKHDLVGHSQAFDVAFSHDGKLLASAGRWESANDHGNGAVIWNVETGIRIRAIRVEVNGGSRAVAFAPNSNLVAIGSQQFDKETDTSAGIVTLAHAASGLLEWQRTESQWAHPVEFAPDGTSVVVLGSKRSIRLLQSNSGQLLCAIEPADAAKAGQWNDLAIDGQQLVIGAADGERSGSVELWDFRDPAVVAAERAANEGFSEPRELVLSMNSLKYMLDLDSGETMDPPARRRPEQRAMDVHSTQMQPYEIPTGLTGLSLEGRKVQPSQWNASAAEVREALSGDNRQPLTDIKYDPAEPATYFFQTADGTIGVLQLLSLTEEPKGIRIRYKTVEKAEP